MHSAEVVGGPSHNRRGEGGTGEPCGPASSPSGGQASEDHEQIDGPHQHREQNFRVGKINSSVGRFSNHSAGNEAQRHERKSQHQRLVADIVDDLERGQAREHPAAALRFQSAFLHQVENAGTEAQEERCVSGKDHEDMHVQPAPSNHVGGEDEGLLASGGDESEQEDERKNHDARRGGLVYQIGDHENDHDQESQQRLRIVHRGGGELTILDDRLGQRNEVKDHSQVRGVERDLAEEFRCAGERHQGVEQSRGIKDERDPQPD